MNKKTTKNIGWGVKYLQFVFLPIQTFVNKEYILLNIAK